MIKTLPISLIAGLASALMFGALSTGSFFALFLLFVAPLPLFITGLGWGHKATAIAAIIGIFALFFIATPHVSVLYLGAIALPATLLTYFALLSRQDEDSGRKDNIEWYPLGRLVVIAAICATGLSVLILVFMGGDLDELYKKFNEAISLMYSGSSSFKDLKTADPEKAKALIGLSAKFAPAAGSALWFFTLLGNIHGAQKILELSGKAIRSEVNIDTIAYPQTYLISFAASLAITFVGGLPGYFAGVYAAIGILAYAIIGFIVLHKITAGHTFRPLMLGTAYLFVLLFTWVALVGMMGIGLFDTFFGLRDKFGNKKN